MLAAAMRKCFDGGRSYVVLPRGLFDYIVPILRDMGATTINKSQYVASFGSDAKIQFLFLSNDGRNLINPEFLEVKGVSPEYVFWDHEAIRQAHNHVIRKYHEYD